LYIKNECFTQNNGSSLVNPSLERKEFVSGLIDVLSLAIDKLLLDDAAAILASARLLRPKLMQLDMFEGWIEMRRQHWAEAAMILSNLELALPEFQTARAFLAVCQYSSGNPAWRTTAEDVLENSSNVEALEIVRTLLAPAEDFLPKDEVKDALPVSPTAVTNMTDMPIHTAFQYRA
jgi:type III secretion protein HrpB1